MWKENSSNGAGGQGAFESNKQKTNLAFWRISISAAARDDEVMIPNYPFNQSHTQNLVSTWELKKKKKRRSKSMSVVSDQVYHSGGEEETRHPARQRGSAAEAQRPGPARRRHPERHRAVPCHWPAAQTGTTGLVSLESAVCVNKKNKK